MTPQRRLLIKVLRAKGRAAFEAGKSSHSNPHSNMNADHWLDGYREAQQEHEQRAASQAVHELEHDVHEFMRLLRAATQPGDNQSAYWRDATHALIDILSRRKP